MSEHTYTAVVRPVEEGGYVVTFPAAIDGDELEDERELQDPAVNRIIEEGTEEYLAGKSRPAEELLDELTREAQDDTAAGGRFDSRRDGCMIFVQSECMSTAATKPKAVEMALVKVRDRAQITLPPEVRQALNVAAGDYLEAEVVEGGVLLKPVAVVERTKAWDEILRIVNRPKWRGPGPEPSEDETMEMVVDELRRVRKEHEGRSR